MNETTVALRDKKLSVLIDGALLDALRNRQAQIAQQTGLRVTLSQTAEAALRAGLQGYTKASNQ